MTRTMNENKNKAFGNFDPNYEKEMDKVYNDMFGFEGICKSMNIKDEKTKKTIERLLKKIGD